MSETTMRERLIRIIQESRAFGRPSFYIVDAVLAEMEKPTEAMLDYTAPHEPSKLIAKAMWSAMIRAAREGK